MVIFLSTENLLDIFVWTLIFISFLCIQFIQDVLLIFIAWVIRNGQDVLDIQYNTKKFFLYEQDPILKLKWRDRRAYRIKCVYVYLWYLQVIFVVKWSIYVDLCCKFNKISAWNYLIFLPAMLYKNGQDFLVMNNG